MGKCVAVPEGNSHRRVAVVCPVTGRAALLSVAARLLCSFAHIFSHKKMGRRKNVQVLARLLEVGERRLAEDTSGGRAKGTGNGPKSDCFPLPLHRTKLFFQLPKILFCRIAKKSVNTLKKPQNLLRELSQSASIQSQRKGENGLNFKCIQFGYTIFFLSKMTCNRGR